MSEAEYQRVHDRIYLAGLRAQATAVGLLQLTTELVGAGVLNDAAVARIKDAIARELTLKRPRSAQREEFESAVRHQLDSLFPGEGSGDAVEPPSSKAS
jgi:hypothetical protein